MGKSGGKVKEKAEVGKKRMGENERLLTIRRGFGGGLGRRCGIVGEFGDGYPQKRKRKGAGFAHIIITKIESRRSDQVEIFHSTY